MKKSHLIKSFRKKKKTECIKRRIYCPCHPYLTIVCEVHSGTCTEELKCRQCIVTVNRSIVSLLLSGIS